MTTGSALDLINSSVVNATSGGNGGAIYVTGGDVALMNGSSIVNTSCEVNGGAVAAFSGSRVTLAPGSSIARTQAGNAGG
eukprot:134967-Prymnesium_polylepis.1